MESMVRTVTTLPSGMVDVTGCGGGGGGGGAGTTGAAAAAAGATGAGWVDAAELVSSAEAAGAGAGSGATGLLRTVCFGGAGAGPGGGTASAAVAGGAGGAVVVASITCFTPLVCEAMVRAASRAASSGTTPVSVMMPSLLATFTEAVLSNGSENILALISVVMASSPGLLHAAAKTKASEKTQRRILCRCMNSPKSLGRGTGRKWLRADAMGAGMSL